MPELSIGTENGSPVELHYTDQGTGNPVVLIHGRPLSGRSWETRSPPWSTPRPGDPNQFPQRVKPSRRPLPITAYSGSEIHQRWTSAPCSVPTTSKGPATHERPH
ncbi:hypothetical protein ACFYQA_08680 [Streptomyces sp. NPDC005774]|uniref:hypothetical protein n=1 Tax=Streptomyces sp. NPDC005774 TaxID=3364728 RepID=UPI0036C01763